MRRSLSRNSAVGMPKSMSYCSAVLNTSPRMGSAPKAEIQKAGCRMSSSVSMANCHTQAMANITAISDKNVFGTPVGNGVCL